MEKKAHIQHLFRESGTDRRLSGMFCGLPAGADGGPGGPSDRTPGSWPRQTV